jgi:hypothetical protein
MHKKLRTLQDPCMKQSKLNYLGNINSKLPADTGFLCNKAPATAVNEMDNQYDVKCHPATGWDVLMLCIP